jgi:beta-galactosidase
MQAIYHARGHSNAAKNPRICGVVAWCGFEYLSERNPVEGVKTPGVMDVFRIPKLGATFYLAQGDPKVKPVIEPDFYWDFGPKSPRGPGAGSAIFSNCEKLEVFLDGKRHATLTPDTKSYPHLPHAPFFVDLDLDGVRHPELRIDGYVGGRRVLSRSFSSDASQDRFAVKADDTALSSAEVDVTRIEFRVVDKFGAGRAFATGKVSFNLSGPGELVGINPFVLDPAGGAGAVWVRTLPDRAGRITVRVRHDKLGEQAVAIEARPDVSVP